VIRESAWLRSFSTRSGGNAWIEITHAQEPRLLWLTAAGMSKRKIAASLGVNATAAGECIRRARRAGLTWPLPEGLSMANS
jgi:hypothetical protein